MSLALGVIGSGAPATLDLLARIQAFTPVKAKPLHILLDLNPEIGATPSAPNLAEMAGALRGAGAEVIAMVSNAAHASGDVVQRASGLPLIDMIQAAAVAARATGARRVGVLGGKSALRLYREYLAAQAMGMVALPPDRQEAFLATLARLRASDQDAAVRRDMASYVVELAAAGAEAVIVGAVDAALALQTEPFRIDVIDPAELLAQRCVSICLGFDPLPVLPGD